jgi:DNA-binding response OmpR family regulator
VIDLPGERVLIVDDEPVVIEVLSRYLTREGMDVFSETDGSRAVEATANRKPDIVLLDILLPGLGGLEVLQELRKATDIPVLFISSKTEPTDLAIGLGVGADDYIKKPFNPTEVVARVKAHLRRYRQSASRSAPPSKAMKLYSSDNLWVDMETREVQVNGKPVSLTAKEFDILALLVQYPNRYFTTSQLIEAVWGPGSADDRTLMVHISRLRRKIEPDPANPSYIVSKRWVGYRFNAQE